MFSFFLPFFLKQEINHPDMAMLPSTSRNLMNINWYKNYYYFYFKKVDMRSRLNPTLSLYLLK